MSKRSSISGRKSAKSMAPSKGDYCVKYVTEFGLNKLFSKSEQTEKTEPADQASSSKADSTMLVGDKET